MMYNQRDDREMGGQTLEAERSDPRLAGGGRAGEFSWMKADASPAPVAPPQRGERPTSEPRDRAYDAGRRGGPFHKIQSNRELVLRIE